MGHICRNRAMVDTTQHFRLVTRALRKLEKHESA